MTQQALVWLAVATMGTVGVFYSTDPLKPPSGRDEGLFWASLIWAAAGGVGVIRELWRMQ